MRTHSDSAALIVEVCDLSQACLEVNAASAWHHCGGQVVLPQRFDAVNNFESSALPARLADMSISGLVDQIVSIPYVQVILHVEKSRQATLDAAQWLWALMPEHCCLYVIGSNALGIKATVKKIIVLLGVDGEQVLNKRRSRIHVFRKPSPEEKNSGAVASECQYQKVPAEEHDSHDLLTRPGVFSVKGLDEGTRVMQLCMRDLEPGRTIIDMACGVGHLGIWALRHWPDVQVHFCDADARAIDCVQRNIKKFSMESQATTQWWAAGEEITTESCDVVLLNPPAHSGKEADLSIARTMFQQAWKCLKVGGRLCLVANRQLSYEDALRQLDANMILLTETSIFKVYLLEKQL